MNRFHVAAAAVAWGSASVSHAALVMNSLVYGVCRAEGENAPVPAELQPLSLSATYSYGPDARGISRSAAATATSSWTANSISLTATAAASLSAPLASDGAGFSASGSGILIYSFTVDQPTTIETRLSTVERYHANDLGRSLCRIGVPDSIPLYSYSSEYNSTLPRFLTLPAGTYQIKIDVLVSFYIGDSNGVGGSGDASTSMTFGFTVVPTPCAATILTTGLVAVARNRRRPHFAR